MTRIAMVAAGFGMAALLSACGGSDAADFADQSGQDIADASRSAMKKLDAVKVSGTVTTDGQEVSIDVQTNDQGDCTGSLGVSGGKAELLGVGGDIWFRPDEAFWRASSGDGADQIMAVVGDKWVVVPTDGDDGGFAEFCNIDDLLDELISDADDDDDKTYKTQEVQDLDGDQVVPVEQTDDEGVSLGYVLVDEPHYLVKIERTKGEDTGSVTFSEFDEEFDVTAPAADDVVDLDNLAG